MKHTQTIYQVDAFTSQPFRGNPAGVCILEKPAEERWMRDVAREMNLSETAFLHPEADNGYRLRWFTPAVEVDLCGHATLASAHTLWETGHLAPDAQANFHTRSGLLTANRRTDGWIELNFPSTPPQAAPAPEGLAEALGVTPVYVGLSRFDYLVEVESEDIVRNLHPDLTALSRLPVRGVIVTSRAVTPEVDFVSRFFAPAAGVPEDPVTGSAHCCLTPYWSQAMGRSQFTAYQASHRGGVVQVRLEGDRVVLAGQAITILKGELFA